MWTPYSERSKRNNPEQLDLRFHNRVSRLCFHRSLSDQARDQLEHLVAQQHKVAIITDRQVWRSLSDADRGWLMRYPRYELKPGETSKSLESLGRLLDFLAEERLDRQSVVVALGGGVVGDIAGFTAAIYQRGVDCWQIPTTLLSMVDSSVGGKTGINLTAGKNLVGAFHQPQYVFIATDFLKTLPAQEFHAGMAEILKYGLLGDESLWNELVRQPLLDASDSRLANVIEHSCYMKAVIVESDEQERADSGGRALLNLGHTFGHAIEKVSGYGQYLHGEAVAIGMVAASLYSAMQWGWGCESVQQIHDTISAHRLPTRLRQPLPLDELVGAMYSDKKNRKGSMRLVLLERPGKAFTFDHVREEWIRKIWQDLGASTSL